MKKSIFITLALLIGTFVIGTAQNAKTIALEQTNGEFTIQSLTLEEGTYVFEISNNSETEKVGFVLTPEGKTDAEFHLKDAYVKKPVEKGETVSSNEVKLTKGEYIYFCPLNKTPQYKLIVK